MSLTALDDRSSGPGQPSHSSGGAKGASGTSAAAKEEQAPPVNSAMEALRLFRPPAIGGSPITDPNSSMPMGRHVGAIIVACLAALGAGTGLGFASVAMPSIEQERWPSPPLRTSQNRWLADILFVGAAFGALVSGYLVTLTGHRKALLLSAGGMVGAWFTVCAASSFSTLLFGRAACGIWMGVTTNCVNLYVTEMAPALKRTFFGGVTERYVIENPYWLAVKGRARDAERAAIRLYGVYPPPEFRLPRADSSASHSEGAPTRRNKKAGRFVACLLLQLLHNLACTQLCLQRAVQVMGTLLEAAYVQAAALVLVVGQVVCALVFASLTRFISRRWLLTASAVLVAVIQITLNPLDCLVFSQWSVSTPPSSTKWDDLGSVCLLVVAYSLGLCHLPALLTGELMPRRHRCLGSSCVWASRWLLAFGLLHYDTQVLANRNARFAIGIAILLLLAATLPLIPETEGRTLADIDRGD
ncbi:solute carrier family 2, facilitated glucose transporter member 8-like [Haemaphysalis longicornis]